ncbi:MAG: J domain-containing protein [Lachnospiraceae bacterium]|nr:J domain-containing protein [Lachnospiraceae bacterium]
MDEIIQIKNASYDRYKDLIMRRDALKKEAFQYEREYVRVFGELILAVFELKVACIRKKKTVAYYQTAANHGRAVDADELAAYLEREMAALNRQLDDMIADTENAKKAETITQADLLKIKRIYHKLVKRIHPDINPLMAQSEELQDLWQRVVTAYNCNDLKLMEESEILIMKLLGDEEGNAPMPDIPDIEEKIQEVEKSISIILDTDPYQYKYLLEDPSAVEEKTEDLENEKRAFEDYSGQLDDMLVAIMENGVGMIWHMN